MRLLLFIFLTTFCSVNAITRTELERWLKAESPKIRTRLDVANHNRKAQMIDQKRTIRNDVQRLSGKRLVVKTYEEIKTKLIEAIKTKLIEAIDPKNKGIVNKTDVAIVDGVNAIITRIRANEQTGLALKADDEIMAKVIEAIDQKNKGIVNKTDVAIAAIAAEVDAAIAVMRANEEAEIARIRAEVEAEIEAEVEATIARTRVTDSLFVGNQEKELTTELLLTHHIIWCSDFHYMLPYMLSSKYALCLWFGYNLAPTLESKLLLIDDGVAKWFLGDTSSLEALKQLICFSCMQMECAISYNEYLRTCDGTSSYEYLHNGSACFTELHRTIINQWLEALPQEGNLTADHLLNALNNVRGFDQKEVTNELSKLKKEKELLELQFKRNEIKSRVAELQAEIDSLNQKLFYLDNENRKELEELQEAQEKELEALGEAQEKKLEALSKAHKKERLALENALGKPQKEQEIKNANEAFVQACKAVETCRAKLKNDFPVVSKETPTHLVEFVKRHNQMPPTVQAQQLVQSSASREGVEKRASVDENDNQSVVSSSSKLSKISGASTVKYQENRLSALHEDRLGEFFDDLRDDRSVFSQQQEQVVQSLSNNKPPASQQNIVPSTQEQIKDKTSESPDQIVPEKNDPFLARYYPEAVGVSALLVAQAGYVLFKAHKASGINNPVAFIKKLSLIKEGLTKAFGVHGVKIGGASLATAIAGLGLFVTASVIKTQQMQAST